MKEALTQLAAWLIFSMEVVEVTVELIEALLITLVVLSMALPIRLGEDEDRGDGAREVVDFD